MLVQVSDSMVVVWWSLVLVLAAEPRELVLVLMLVLVSQRVLVLMLGWLLESWWQVLVVVAGSRSGMSLVLSSRHRRGGDRNARERRQPFPYSSMGGAFWAWGFTLVCGCALALA